MAQTQSAEQFTKAAARLRKERMRVSRYEPDSYTVENRTKGRTCHVRIDRSLRAFSSGVVTRVLETPAPGLGLFAVEVRCVVCHRMHHEAGACPHGKEMKRRRAA